MLLLNASGCLDALTAPEVARQLDGFVTKTITPLPYLSEALERPPALLGFRSEHHAEVAALVPNAEVVIDPVLVTDVMPHDRDVLACGPEPMLDAVRTLVPDAQLAWEAPMACGYGACYGCVVEIDGELKRLCVEGPVLCSS